MFWNIQNSKIMCIVVSTINFMLEKYKIWRSYLCRFHVCFVKREDLARFNQIVIHFPVINAFLFWCVVVVRTTWKEIMHEK